MVCLSFMALVCKCWHVLCSNQSSYYSVTARLLYAYFCLLSTAHRKRKRLQNKLFKWYIARPMSSICALNVEIRWAKCKKNDYYGACWIWTHHLLLQYFSEVFIWQLQYCFGKSIHAFVHSFQCVEGTGALT